MGPAHRNEKAERSYGPALGMKRRNEAEEVTVTGRRAGIVRVGISGWSYRHWRGDFYPQGLPVKRELEFALERFTTIEVNRTFYSLVSPASFRRWYECAPEGFQYAIKGSRFITHNKKLKDVEDGLANFFASGLLELGEKLGPILWQVGPRLAFDRNRLRGFLEQLPSDTAELSWMARRQTLPGRETVTETDQVRPVRHALEARHPSWFTGEAASLVREFGVAFAASHSSRWPYVETITAPFAYVRLHGPVQLYSSPYSSRFLWDLAHRIVDWSGGHPDPTKPGTHRLDRDVYVYFDNDSGGHAPRQARLLDQMVTALLTGNPQSQVGQDQSNV